MRVLAAYGVRVRPAAEQDARSAQPVKGLVVETAWDAYRLGAQLSPGDVIDAVDGTPVTDAVDLLQLAELPAGAAHTIRVLRGARSLQVPLETGAARPGEGTSATAPGLTLGGRTGYLVRAVDPQSPAARAGLLAGDRILTINRVAPRDERELRRLLATGGSSRASLEIERDGRRELLVIQ